MTLGQSDEKGFDRVSSTQMFSRQPVTIVLLSAFGVLVLPMKCEEILSECIYVLFEF